MTHLAGPHVERLIGLLARLPGLGPRSAQRAVLDLVGRKQSLLSPLAGAMSAVLESTVTCGICGNIDSRDPCAICADPGRDESLLCVIESVGDLWALERSGAMGGRYHVLGGVLSALDGVGPGDLNLAQLEERAGNPAVTEVILALSATVDGQITAHYVTECLAGCDVAVMQLAHGVPVGGELDYLDDATLAAAVRARRPVHSAGE